MKQSHRRLAIAAAGLAITLGVTACSSGSGTSGSSSSSASGGSDIKVGVVISLSGALQPYGQAYQRGLKAGLDYATNGTDTVNGRKIDLEYSDDATTAATGVAAVTKLAGDGVKIILGGVSSDVSSQIAPLAAQNNLLYITGATSAALTGVNQNTFRSMSDSYQSSAAFKQVVSQNGQAPAKVTVFTQDSAFGTAQVAAVKTVFAGTSTNVASILAPAAANDYTPFANQLASSGSNAAYVGWSGDGSTMYQALNQQGVYDKIPDVYTLLGVPAGWAGYGQDASKIKAIILWGGDSGSGPAFDAYRKMVDDPGQGYGLPQGSAGFTAAQMLVHAIQTGNADDVSTLIKALEGWSFQSPWGASTVRAADHAFIQPLFAGKLSGPPTARVATVTQTIPAASIAPPVKKTAWAK